MLQHIAEAAAAHSTDEVTDIPKKEHYVYSKKKERKKKEASRNAIHLNKTTFVGYWHFALRLLLYLFVGFVISWLFCCCFCCSNCCFVFRSIVLISIVFCSCCCCSFVFKHCSDTCLFVCLPYSTRFYMMGISRVFLL